MKNRDRVYWPKPWLLVTPTEVWCFACPYAPGCWRHKPRTRNGFRKAIKMHRRCGHFGNHIDNA